MDRVLAAILVMWVFLGAPALCLAGVEVHSCGCETSVCPECRPVPCRDTHDCHDDPCRTVACRWDQDDPVEPGVCRSAADHASASLACVAPAASGDVFSDSFIGGCPDGQSPPANGWSDLFAMRGLPLLI